MKLLNKKFSTFHVGAGLLTSVALPSIALLLLMPSNASPCSERYMTVMVFPLENAGQLLTAADLQARSGGTNEGLLENLEIARVEHTRTSVAMRIALPKGSASPTSSIAPKGGVSFPWEPRSIQGKNAACLSYEVLIPPDFDFHLGGSLPGIRGIDQSSDGFITRLAWRQNGNAGVTQTNGRNIDELVAEDQNITFPLGQWVKLDQEVILNAPGQADGVLRVWIDGALSVERTDMVYRTKSEITISGVAADVFYGAGDATSRAPRDTKIWLSPFEIRWQ